MSAMSPTVLISGKYRFFFNSREENRKHIHVATTEGTAKIWLEPNIGLTEAYNLDSHELTEILKIVEEKKNEFIGNWNKHFGL